MDERIGFALMGAVVLIGCIVAPLAVGAAFGSWWALVAGVCGYAVAALSVWLYVHFGGA